MAMTFPSRIAGKEAAVPAAVVVEECPLVVEDESLLVVEDPVEWWVAEAPVLGSGAASGCEDRERDSPMATPDTAPATSNPAKTARRRR